MLVAIVLGNRINDDGTMSEIMSRRLATALFVNNTFSPSKIILSGGIANKKVGLSEASMMRDYLVAHGIPDEKLILEEQSLTTKQNAEFSVPIAVGLGATEILLLTSLEHMSRPHLNPINLFSKQLSKYPQINLSAYGKR